MVNALVPVATGDEDPLCREAAVAALGAIGDPAGLPAVLEATKDRPAVRRRAVLALAPFEGPEVDAAIERARGDLEARCRPVQTGVSDESKVEILRGLDEGDVVISGPYRVFEKLKDGKPVVELAEKGDGGP